MKPIVKVFLVIGALLACFLVWDLTFNGGGIIDTAWGAIANPINETYQNLTGSSEDLVPDSITTETSLEDGKVN